MSQVFFIVTNEHILFATRMVKIAGKTNASLAVTRIMMKMVPITFSKWAMMPLPKFSTEVSVGETANILFTI